MDWFVWGQVLIHSSRTILKRFYMQQNLTQVTIIYYHVDSLELIHAVKYFPSNQHGRVVIPKIFKEGKSIIAVCKGEIQILNKVGDRILSVGEVA